MKERFAMTLPEQKRVLYSLGAATEDMEPLLEYTKNSFVPCEVSDNDFDDFLIKWHPVMLTASSEGCAAAINNHLAREDLRIVFNSPEMITLELYSSIAGTIPVITAENTTDFESIVRNIIYKGKKVENISEMGASFAFGKSNRFIILSKKPYSNVSAERMGLANDEWREKSMSIRREHECTHYYTRRFFNSSKNNLHDELIADFRGLYKTFGTYKAEWFLKFLGLSEDSHGVRGRVKIYTSRLSGAAAEIIEKIAIIAANKLEEWSKTDEFLGMSESEQMNRLCEKDLLEYV